MATETISFPEEKIPVLVRVIRRGLVHEKDREVKQQLEKQCETLMEYHETLQRAEDE